VRHLALTVAGWWITWVLFGLVAYFGAIALICAVVCRFTRIQDRKHAALVASETDAAAGDLWTAADRDILEGKRLP
jgi:hypothetical protein